MAEKIEFHVGTRLRRNHKRLHDEPGSHLDRMIGCLVVVIHVMKIENEPPGAGVKIVEGFDNGIDDFYIPGAVAGIHHSFLTTEFFEIVVA